MLLYLYTSGGRAFWNLRGLHFSELFRDYLDTTSSDDAKSEIET